MKKFTVLSLVAVSVALAQDSLPTADQILDKYVQALGGRSALERLKSRYAKGTMELLDYGITANTESYAKAPNQVITIITVEGYGSVRQGFDGVTAWSESPDRGLRDLTGGEAARRKRSAAFDRPLRFKDGFQSVTVKGKEAAGGKEAFVLEAKPPEGNVERYFFDAESGLLVQYEADMETDNGVVRASVSFSDYKDSDGVKVPMTSRLQSQGLNYTARTSEVKHNVEIDDAKFKKPAQ